MQKVTCSVEALEEMADTLWYVRLKPAVAVDFLAGQYLLVVMAKTINVHFRLLMP